MKMNEVVNQQSIQFPQEECRLNATQESISALLNSLFPEQQREEKEIREVKAVLGVLTTKLSIDEIQTIVSEIQYLVTAWLDDYEKQLFDGKTIREILNEG